MQILHIETLTKSVRPPMGLGDREFPMVELPNWSILRARLTKVGFPSFSHAIHMGNEPVWLKKLSQFYTFSVHENLLFGSKGLDHNCSMFFSTLIFKDVALT